MLACYLGILEANDISIYVRYKENAAEVEIVQTMSQMASR